MSETPGQWPTMPGSFRPPTQAAPDPLRVPHPKTLAPEPMPGQAQPPAADAALPTSQPTAPNLDSPAMTPPPSQLPAADAGEAARVPCPHCGVMVATWESFCEACGGELTPTTAAPVAAAVGTESPIESTTGTAPPAPRSTDLEVVAPQTHTCSQCGGVVGPDGYCTQCGAKALSPRDHFTETPSAWVAGACDKGIRHHRNEDAMALWSEAGSLAGPQAHAILVVCDGVSSSEDSDVAALAAARRARDVLMAARPQGVGTPESKDAAYGGAYVEAVAQANQAVIEHTRPESTNAASCTFVAGIVDGTRIHYANVGDSRAYWISDSPEQSTMLSLDDSIAQARIAMGVDRTEAENGYQAHAITKWLGRDAEDTSPRTGAFDVPGPGWLLVCSDGLWNYCTEPADLARLFAEQLARAQATTVVALAEALVAWANEQGGKDNITVALARFGDWPQLGAPPAPPAVDVAQPVATTDGVPAPADGVPGGPAGREAAAPAEPARTGSTAAPRPGSAAVSPAPDTLDQGSPAPTEGH